MAAPAQDAGDGWVEHVQERPVWKPETCRATAVQGYLLTRQELPDGVGGRPWVAYVVRLTAPCLAVKLGADAPAEVAAGRQVLVPETARLRSLQQYLSPKAIVEVRVEALERLAKVEGRPWSYRIAANKASLVPRTALTPVQVRLALPPAQDDGESVDDVPF